MRYYVYVLMHGDVPFYVGKGTGSRMYKHRKEALRETSQSLLHNTIRKILSDGGEIGYLKIFHTDDPQLAYDVEKQTIRSIGRKSLGLGTLCNMTDGGEGVVNPVPWTDERKKAWSAHLKEAFKKRKKPTGYPGPHIPVSEATKKKLSESGKRYNQTPAGIAKIKRVADQKRGKPRILSEEAREKMRDAARRTNLLKAEKKA